MKPVVSDTIVGVGAALAAGVSAYEHGGKVDVLVPIAIAGVYGTSAGYGAIQVGRCRSEHEKRPAWSLAEMPAVM